MTTVGAGTRIGDDEDPADVARSIADDGHHPVWLFDDRTGRRQSWVAFGIRLRITVRVGGAEIDDLVGLLGTSWPDQIGNDFSRDPWNAFDRILQIPAVASATQDIPALFHFAFEAAHVDDSIDYPPGVTDDTLLAEFIVPEDAIVFPAGREHRTDRLSRRSVADQGQVADNRLGDAGSRGGPVPDEPTVGYAKAFESVIGHIARGDAYQVVVGHAGHHERLAENPWVLYRRMVANAPVPYGFTWPLGDGRTLVGASPECFARFDGTELHLRPLAGSIRRSGNDEVDLPALERFRADTKEFGEHLMLVDLCRDDIAKTCVPGTVELRSEFEVEAYADVFHFASHVVGRLDRRHGPFAAMRRIFPAGTMTGAPRLRAMEIIAAVEPEPRGPYAGVVGHVHADGRFDSAICIRMVEVSATRCTTHAAGGVLWGSSVDREWDEIKAKLAGCERAVRGADAGRGH